MAILALAVIHILVIPLYINKNCRPATSTYCWRSVVKEKRTQPVQSLLLSLVIVRLSRDFFLPQSTQRCIDGEVESLIVALSISLAVVGCHDVLTRPLHDQRYMLPVSQVWTPDLWPLNMYVKAVIAHLIA